MTPSTQQDKSIEGFDKLREVIPAGVGSPTRAFRAVEEAPIVVDRGEGAELIDIDGNRFIDYHCSWGALIHGHAHPKVVQAVQETAARGTSFGMSCQLEELLARKIVSAVKSVDQVRFVSSGTEATMSAARLARGYTGRDYILKFTGCYHGHADFFLVQGGSSMVGMSPTSSSAGIPNEIVKYTVCLPYNDVKATEEFFGDPKFRDNIAAVIVEPVAGNMGVAPASTEFLQMLREQTRETGALLIFDEVITGFRVGWSGAQGLYGIDADLSCFGKVMSGGSPAAAFGGSKEIMAHLAPDGPVYQAGTLSGNPMCAQAGLQTLQMLEVDGTFEELERKTRSVTEPIQAYMAQKNMNACVQQVGSMFTLFWGQKQVRNFDDALKLDLAQHKRFFSHIFERGIFFPPSQYEASFVTTAHTKEQLDYTRNVILEFLDKEN